MSTLLDHIDRLSRHAQSLKAISASIVSENPISGPFTKAVLHSQLEYLIRDVEPGETSLFTLAQDPSAHPNAVEEYDVGRVPFTGATPLRRRPGKDASRPDKEPEPEIYAQAALKYLDRFDTVRPMPRARSQVESILSELASTRERIQALTHTLKELSVNRALSSPRSTMKEEERRIANLQKRLEGAKLRKEAAITAQKQQSAKPKPAIRRTIPVSRSPIRPPPPQMSTPAKGTPRTPAVPSSSSKFWTTPAKAGQALRYSASGLGSSLMDESLIIGGEIGDISGSDLGTPVSIDLPTTRERMGMEERLEMDKRVQDGGEVEQGSQLDVDMTFDELKSEEGESDTEADKTVVFSKPSMPSPPPTPPPQLEDEIELLPEITPVATPTKRSTRKIKVTVEVERIIARIWELIGEVILPGYLFIDAERKPLKAKETIAHLQTLTQTAITPSLPSSPSSMSSLSTGQAAMPTVQAILNASIILYLLSSPAHRAPLKEVKDLLIRTGGQTAARTVYACVAKRLIKIDRTGREQIVTFGA